jgi:cell shape-determining protein MreC
MVVVAYSLILARVPSVRNFDSITLLFSDHTLDISVKENNGVSCRNHEWKVHESETKYARNSRHSQAIQTGQFRNDAPHNLM